MPKSKKPTRDELFKALATLREDALMAIDESWDKTQDGFQAQVDAIEILFVRDGRKIPEYHKETEDD